MRVALIDPGEFSPPYDAALAEGLMAAGHAVTLIGMAGGGLGTVPGLAHVGHFYRPLAGTGGGLLPERLARLAKGLVHPLDMLRLPRLLRRLGAEVIHLQWAPLPLLDQALLAGLRRVAPVVLTVHDTNPYNGAEPWLMSAGMDRLTRAADAVICHTGQGRRRLLARAVEAEKLHVVPHGLLAGAAASGPVANGAADGRLRLLQFGKIKPYKGVDVLLQALARLEPAERARLDVRIVGEPHLDPRPLLDLASTLGLGDCVRFELGFLPEHVMEARFAEADALLFPYREIEASGVLMQAVARGLPVVASRVGLFAELLRDGAEALLTPPGDVAALAEALRRLVARPASLRAMRRAMRALRESIPGWPAIGERTALVYAAAAERHGRMAQAPRLRESRT